MGGRDDGVVVEGCEDGCYGWFAEFAAGGGGDA